MNPKIFFRIFLAFLLALILYFGYTQYCAYKNVKHSKEVKIGSSIDEMLVIMGSPKNFRPSNRRKGNALYFYEPPFGGSEGIDIYVDTLQNKVVEIVYFK